MRLARVTRNFDAGFHQLFAPEEIPINIEKERQKLIKKPR